MRAHERAPGRQPARPLTKGKILETLEENRDRIRALGVRRLALFGSYARGEQTAQSDIDFLVEFEPGRGLFDDFVGLYHLLEDLFGKKVDLGEPHLLRKGLRKPILEGVLVDAQL